MRLLYVFTIVLATIIGFQAKNQCEPFVCYKIYRPVCGCRTFPNECVLNYFNCTAPADKKYVLVANGVCPKPDGPLWIPPGFIEKSKQKLT